MADINGVMMQYFHWYTSTEGTLWDEVKANAADLAKVGITAVWLPPAYKGAGGTFDVGYGVYDLYDLGEFYQKGTVRTKYGTKIQYLAAIQALHAVGIQVYADTVLNHRDGADRSETMMATPFANYNRHQQVGPYQQIEAYTHFTFPGRKGQYSSTELHWWHFDGVSYNQCKPDDRGIVYLLEGKKFDNFVSLENGNFAYLLGCDLDYESEQVRQEITQWGTWYLDTTRIDGFRLDALKHISAWFFVQWLDAMRAHAGRDLFVVGEYWSQEIQILHWYVDVTGGRMSVFDVPLHYNFHRASKSGGYYDMRTILEGTMMQQNPLRAVTFVENHDSQPLQSLESLVESWFKPLAYAIILLRREGYPCLFYADYYGATYHDRGHDIILNSHRFVLDKLLRARKDYAYGEQVDYFDHPDRIGWVRLGTPEHPKAMAVIMSDGPGGSKWMSVDRPGATFYDITGNISEPIRINEFGWAEFRCNGGSVSVWVQS